jgi:hypothetical protein
VLVPALELFPISPFAARRRLVELEAERAAALASGTDPGDPYVADLEWELEAWRGIYVTTAVTEIASLRAQLGEPLRDGPSTVEY